MVSSNTENYNNSHVQFFVKFAHKKHIQAPDLNIIFLSPGRLSGRNSVTSDKVNFRPDIRQNLFLKKSRISKVCVASKTIWIYSTLINMVNNLGKHMSISIHVIHVIFVIIRVFVYVELSNTM